MSMRAQPVGSVFQRMPRLVRELATKTHKKVRLEMAGETTEVDRSIIERLGDPLTHIIRNSVDHGVESPADRLAAGKPEEGVIRLSAEHRGGRIVIEIKDDGAGINSERVLKKAREKGLVRPDAQLTEDEIGNLIMLPGFSTAETISDISGRGVGMDVVRSNIQDIGGRISLKSVRGTRHDDSARAAADARGHGRHGHQGRQPDLRHAACHRSSSACGRRARKSAT